MNKEPTMRKEMRAKNQHCVYG
ncbi:hypothetical protein Gotur_019732 [Gossypium turneri]